MASSSSRKHTQEASPEQDRVDADVKPFKRAKKAAQPPPSEDEEEPQQEREQDEDDQQDNQSSPPPRRRLNGHPSNGRAVEEDDEDAMDEDDEQDEEEQDDENVADGSGTLNDISDELRKRLAQRGEDGFLPGAVVRVGFKNFLTYESAEFFPGPHLNMIIGPNGTGKSTIVCGIAIGLGWSPKVLGRADQVELFLRNKSSKGHTEIELKSPNGPNGEKGKNVIVKREITRGSNKTKFWLNGEPATAKAIREKVIALNIQIGNLCSFLPQDKVAEFATMSPQELLRQTQKAAGPAKMTEWHENLIRLGKECKTLYHNLEIKKTELERARAKTSRLEGDANDARQRADLATEILFLERMIPFAEYNTSRMIWEQFKAERAQAHADHKKAVAMVEPFRELAGALEDRADEADRSVTHLLDNQKEIEKKQSKLKMEISNLDDNKDQLHDKIDNVKKKAAKRADDIVEVERRIEKLNNDWENRAEPQSKDELEAQRFGLKKDQSEVDEAISREVEGEKRNIQRTITDKQGEITRQENRMRQLNEVSHRRLENLKRWPDSEYIVQLVEVIRRDKQNVINGGQSIFKMEVFEPPCLSVDVTDKDMAGLVEACIGGTQMRTVVVQCEEDYRTIASFTDGPNNVIKQWLKRLHWTKIDRPYQPQQGPVPRDQLVDIGFDGYAIDFIKAPDPVKAFLEIHAGLGRSAVARRKVGGGDGISWDRIQTVDLRSFVAGDTKYSTSISRYGDKSKSSGTAAINPARSFAGAVDEEAIKEVRRLIDEARVEIGRTKKMDEKLRERSKELDTARSRIQDKLEEVKEQLDNLRKVEQKNARIKISLEEMKRKLRTLQNAPSEEDLKSRYQRELKSVIKEKLKLDLEHTDLSRRASKTYHRLVDEQLALIQLQANQHAVSELCAQEQEAEENAAKAFNTADKKFKDQKVKTRGMLGTAQAQLEELDDDTRENFMARKEELTTANNGALPEPEHLQEQRTTLENELDGLGGEDPAVIQKYEKAMADIAQVEREHHSLETKEQTMSRVIKSIKAKWVPELEKLVKNFNRKFSAAMDSLDDRGEIRIREHEDYAEWAIEILVSFRATDKMQLLTATHQSGGERSLSTIMYLMSLIELSNAPFSVVDEINQGMDVRAERAVHNRMVDVTCDPNAGQFFLLTPKLLTDLHYHENMRVLVICNGEWLPERAPKDTKGKMFLRHILDRNKRKMAIAGN